MNKQFDIFEIEYLIKQLTEFGKTMNKASNYIEEIREENEKLRREKEELEKEIEDLKNG